MLNKTYRISRYITLIVWLLAACKPTRIESQSTATLQPANHSFANLFKPPECLSYCWAGIEVDKTSFDQARKIITTRYGFENVENVNSENLTWTAHGFDGLNQGYLIFSNDVVVDILLIFDSSTDFTVRDVLEIFGKPTWVNVASQPNNPCLGFSLLYPTIRSSVSLDTSEGKNGIYSSQKVFVVRFLQPQITENSNVNDGYLVKWSGYKAYCGD